MYRVTIYNGTESTIIHEVSVDPADPHLYSCTLTEGSSGEIDTLQFVILPNNPGYELLNSRTTMVEVLNTKTNRTEFTGRVLTITPEMLEDGTIYKTVICEDRLGFLCDSVQPYLAKTTYYDDGDRTGVEQFLDLLLENHNSQVEDYKKIYRGTVTFTTSTNNVTKGLTYETTWEAITQKLLTDLGGEIQLYEDDGVLYLDYTTELGQIDEDVVIEFGRNMRSISQEIDPTSVITRLIPLGAHLEADGTEEDEVDTDDYVTIASVNDGVIYLDDEDAQAVYGIVEGVVEWEDVTEPSNLLTKAQNWLDQQTVADKITLSALDLSLIGLDDSAIERYNYYRVVNAAIGLDAYLRVIKRTVNICNPSDITYEMGDRTQSLAAALTSTSNAASGASDAASALSASLSKTVNTLIVAYISTGVLDATYVTAEYLSTVVADIESAIIDEATIRELIVSYGYITSADIETLTADVAAIKSAYISSAEIDTLLANYILAGELNAAVADLGYLTADSAEITDLAAAVADIEKAYITEADIELLLASYATITDLNTVTANITDLTADIASINALLAGSVGTGTVQTIHLTADNSTIDEAVITNALINNAIMSTLLAGTIYTDYVTIMSESGNLYIADNTIQIMDGESVVRVQIGEDASGDYNLYLWDADGNLIWDAQGLTEAGLTGNGAIIKDAAIADDAAISGYKLDIESVISCIEDDGSLTVDYAQVAINDSTLSAWYTTVNSAVSDLESSTSTLQTGLSVVQGQIEAKIWQDDIDTAIDGVETEITTLTSNYTSISADLDGITAQVSTLETTVAEQAETVNGLIKRHEIYYAVSESPDYYPSLKDDGTTAILDTCVLDSMVLGNSGTWTTDRPTVGEDEYLWQREYILYADGTEEWTDPVLITDETTRTLISSLTEKTSELEMTDESIKSSVTSLQTEIYNNYSTTTVISTLIEQAVTDSEASITESISATYATMEYADEAASAAEDAANEATDTKLLNYSTTTDVTTAISQAVTDSEASITESISATYATMTYADNAAGDAQSAAESYADSAANTAQSAAESYADAAASSAEENANSYTDTKLTSYSTTTEVSNTIEQYVSESEAAIKEEISATYVTIESLTDSEGTLLGDYSTTTQVNNAISQAVSDSENVITALVSTLEETVNGLIKKHVIYYAVSESNSYYPSLTDDGTTSVLDTAVLDTMILDNSGTWTTDKPTVGEDEYLWQCEYILYADGTEEWTDPVLVTDETTRTLLSSLTEKTAELEIADSNISATVTYLSRNLYTNYSTTTEITTAIEEAITDSEASISESISATYATITYADNAASGAQSAAEAYADSAANDALDTANTYTDTQLKEYSTTTDVTTAITQAVSDSEASISESISATYATITYADSAASGAQSAAETYADGVAETAESNANTYTDNKLVSYYSITQTNEIIQEVTDEINSITLSVSTVESNVNSSIKTYKVYYAVSESADYYPTHGDDGTTAALDAAVLDTMVLDNSGEWTEEQPEAADGEYIWVSYYIEYVNGTSEWTKPTLLTDTAARDRITSLEEKTAELELTNESITATVTALSTDIHNNYSTTTDITVLIEESISDSEAAITSSIEATYATMTYADEAAGTAESDANSYTDGQLSSYYTIEQTNEITQSITDDMNAISLSVTNAISTAEGYTDSQISATLVLKITDGVGVLSANVDYVEFSCGDFVINGDNGGQFTFDASGNATFSGTLNAASGTFSGDLNAAGGTFTGTLSGADGDFSGTVTATYLVANTGGEIGGWTITSNALYYGTSSTTSTSAGIYFGSGVLRAVASAGTITMLEKGILTTRGYSKYTTSDGSVYYATASVYGGITLNYRDSSDVTNSSLGYFSMTAGEIAGYYDGSRWFYVTNSSQKLYANGTISSSSSDIRLKDNIEDCEIESLPVIRRIRMRQFDWNDRDEDIHQDIGMVADELEAIDPRLSVGGGYFDDGNMMIKTVDTFYLMGYVIKGLQELDEYVTTTYQSAEARIAELESQVADLTAQLQLLQAA
ncbi:MAG: phage tail protein [Lachnospiraceae bacterium]|nr:phage tail protein [Lachnospiraceae bacterium]